MENPCCQYICIFKKTIFWIKKKAFSDKKRSYTRYTEILTCLCHTVLHIVVSKYYLVDCPSSLVIFNECLCFPTFMIQANKICSESNVYFLLCHYFIGQHHVLLYTFTSKKNTKHAKIWRFENTKYFSLMNTLVFENLSIFKQNTNA